MAVKKKPMPGKKKAIASQKETPKADPAKHLMDGRRWRPIRNVVPDRIDLRDRPYLPSVTVIPFESLSPRIDIPVLYQGETNACTGFALASVLYHLQISARRHPKESQVSPYMLYSMARRYDEFPGWKGDTGSSLRGAMKGWYKQGACRADLWPGYDMPKPPAHTASASVDWWLDSVRRPMGAYYRVDVRSITDMQVALTEMGILYASAAVHSGWDTGFNVKDNPWVIPQRKVLPNDGAHAFAFVGYTRDGFIVHNSWGGDWGHDGRAVLTYEDWLENAMDCWVAQIGVVTSLHEEIAASKSLRVVGKTVRLASDATLRYREISPFIVDMANNGLLSNTGDFRTQPSDVEALVNQQVAQARAEWKLGTSDVMDIAIYAHGGLVAEDGAAETASKWIPALYNAQIFPIFFMWETGLFDTLKNRLADVLAGQPRTTGGFVDRLKNWYNARLEKLLSAPGTMVWEEMKKNADCISSFKGSGGMQLFEACRNSPYFKDMKKVRLHLIGHSAGAIVHSLIVKRLGDMGWNFESVNFMAPAVRYDSFAEQVLPAIQSGKVKAYNQFSLTDEIELQDHTCEPILGYSRSLLYLVSESFEHGVETGILGMEKYLELNAAALKLPNVKLYSSPSQYSQSTTHGGFDDDSVTMKKVIALIKNGQ